MLYIAYIWKVAIIFFQIWKRTNKCNQSITIDHLEKINKYDLFYLKKSSMLVPHHLVSLAFAINDSLKCCYINSTTNRLTNDIHPK